MQIGKMDRYVRFEQKVVTKDADYGSEVVSWQTYKECWASITDITTNRMHEYTFGDLRSLNRPCKIIVRYDEKIDPTMRIVCLDRNDRILEIVSKPGELGRREAMEFIAQDYSTENG
jgi:SPP1 family predicted phage head-tail adaptor